MKKETAEAELQENLLIKECENVKQQLEKMTLKIPVKTGEEDRVFGSVSTKQIVSELKKQGIEIDKKGIIIDGSLTSLGVHKVKVELHKKVIAELKVQLVKEK